MIRFVALAAVFTSAALLVQADQGDPEKDKKALVGNWQVVRLEAPGKSASKEEMEKFRMIITANELRLSEPGRKEETIKYKLDATKKPAHLDMFPPGKEPTVKGIYELKGDTLRLCFGKEGSERPTSFDAINQKVTVMELKRDKK